jgi:acetyltransferase-like isoleucine patch superfamily enzyme
MIAPLEQLRPVGPARIGRIITRIRQYGLLGYLLGLWLRPQFQQAGVLLVRGGLPLPSIENRGGRIEVGNCALFSGVRLECWNGARIRVGAGTYLNRGVEIVAGGSVTIGRDCKIARDVIIMDTDQHPLPEGELVVRPVNIGDRVWIGARAMVLKGVDIGHDSVIGAGAIVTRSVPPHSTVVGTAARILRTHSTTETLNHLSTPVQSS